MNPILDILKWLHTKQILGVWSDLEACLHGKNRYGGTVAEIYSFRLERAGRPTKEEPVDCRNALQSLKAIVLAFIAYHGDEITATIEDQPINQYDADTEQLMIRYHVAIKRI